MVSGVCFAVPAMAGDSLAVIKKRFAVLVCALLAGAALLLLQGYTCSAHAEDSGVVINEFSVPTADGNATAITVGPDGNTWFIETGGNKVGRITTGGVITEFAIPTADSNPEDITPGPDGNLWFTESNTDKVGRIKTSGVIAEFAVPTAHSRPTLITAGPDGKMWFTETRSNKIGRISPNGVIAEFAIPTAHSHPTAITAGPDGKMWFVEPSGNNVCRITTSGIIAEFSIPTANSNPVALTEGPDGNMWFTENLGGKIGRITTGGVITEFAVPTAISIGTITAGPDGNLWFVDGIRNTISRITPAGVITQFPIPTDNSDPLRITTGPDGNMWFTEVDVNKIGQVVIPGSLVIPSAGPGGTISPDGPQKAAPGETVSFIIMPDAGYGISSVSGCGGTLSGNTYTTGPATADCTVSVTFAPAYKIAGTVKNASGVPMQGVTMTLSGGAIGTITTTTNSSGSYKFRGLVNGTYTITPGKMGKIFTPDSRTETINGANVTGRKFTGRKGNDVSTLIGTMKEVMPTPDISAGPISAKAGSRSREATTALLSNIVAAEAWSFSEVSPGTGSATLILTKRSSGAISLTVGSLAYYDVAVGFTVSGSSLTGTASVNSAALSLSASGILYGGGYSGNCTVGFNGTANNGHATGTAYTDCPSVCNGQSCTPYSSQGTWNGVRTSGSGVTQPYLETCEVTGQVLQTTGGAGISSVTVSLKIPGVGVIGTATTDTNGQYSFAPIAAGTYKIVATKAGYVFPGPQPLTFSACTGTDPVTGDGTVSVPTISRSSYILWAYSNKPNTKVVITQGTIKINKVTSASVVCTTAANPGTACTESNPYFVKFKNLNGTWTVGAKKTGFNCTGVTSPITFPVGTTGDAVETITCTK
jgi:streptogramin lyase